MSSYFDGCRAHPYWWLEAPRSDAPTGPLPKRADVAVVGSGFTGLTAALILARAGREVVVLESSCTGFGASTRNGGQIGSGNHKLSIETLSRSLGPDKARRLYREGTDILDWFVGFIADEGIECDFRRCGRFRGAVTPKHYEGLVRELESANRFAGVEGFPVDKADLGDEIQSDRYAGGVVLTSDGSVHPARLHDGILKRACAAGVRVLPNTRVQGYEGEEDNVQVTTSRGRLSCRDLIVATNGYTGKADKRFKNKIVRAESGIIATEPLLTGTAQRLLPNDRVYGDTRRVVNYFRLSPDRRRVVYGGRLPARTHDHPARYEALRRVMVGVLPALADIRIEYCWSGYVGMTRDGFPHIGRDRGVYYAMGYCGSGVTRSCYFGYKIALQLQGRPEGRTEFDDLAFRSHRWAARLPFAVNLYVTGLRLRDRLDR